MGSAGACADWGLAASLGALPAAATKRPRGAWVRGSSAVGQGAARGLGAHPSHPGPDWSSDPPNRVPYRQGPPRGARAAGTRAPGGPRLCRSAVWAGSTCLQAGCTPKLPQGLWGDLGMPSISPLHGDGARDGGCGLVCGTAAAFVRQAGRVPLRSAYAARANPKPGPLTLALTLALTLTRTPTPKPTLTWTGALALRLTPNLTIVILP